jgi:hypothetical protein
MLLRVPSEHINDEIDETNIFVFFLQWTFFPSYPIYQVVSKASDAHSYIDEVAMWVYGSSTFFEVIAILGALSVTFFGGGMPANVRNALGFGSYITTPSIVCTIAFVYAYISYYIFWWFTPLFVSTIFFYLQVYVFMPLMVVVGPILNIGMVVFGAAAVAAAEEHRRR